MIAPGLDQTLVDGPHRILVIDKELDELWWIRLPRKHKNGKRCTYVAGPIRVALSAAATALAEGKIVAAEFKAPPYYTMTDDDYIRAANGDVDEQERRKARLRWRDRDWDTIAPIVESRSTRALVTSFGTSPSLAAERACETGVDKVTVLRLINQYLAGGSVRNALLPRTDLCGAPGKERQQKVRLGRKRTAVKRGDSADEGYVLTDLDKERLGRGYALIDDKTNAHAAFLLVSGAFWGTRVVQADGGTKTELWAAQRRPTFRQFLYWGEKRNTKEVKRKRVGADRWGKRSTHFGGSTQSQVGAFGHMGVFDSTSCDLYLTSMWNRQTKLSPATRTVLLEQRSTALLGFYVGFEKTSSSVALQAILSGAESPEEKVDLCKRYGVESTVDDWLGILPRRFLADNGELKTVELTEAEAQFRFGIEYTRAYAGELKGDVESSHRTFHKKLDHTVEGASPGMKRRERGEDHPANDALWNFHEYMRHFLQEAVDWQRTEVPNLAPTQMLKEGIRPTRVKIAHWLKEHAQRADIPYDIEQLRAFTLPDHPAVIERNGIFLKDPNDRRISQFRYFSSELQDLEVYQDAATNRRAIPIFVKCNKVDLRQIWMASPHGLLCIPNVDADADLVVEATEEDMVAHLDSEAAYRDSARNAAEQAQLDKLLARRATSELARKEIKAEQSKGNKRPTKSQVKKGLRKNTAEERAKLAAKNLPEAPEATESPGGAAPITKAAESAMVAFLRNRNGQPR